DATGIAEQVAEQGNAGTFGVFEQQRRASGAQGAVTDLRDFQIGVDFRLDPFQLALFFKQREEVTQILECHHFLFMELKNSSLVLVSLSLSRMNSVACTSSIALRILRRIHMRCSSSSEVSSSSRRVPERRTLMAG